MCYDGPPLNYSNIIKNLLILTEIHIEKCGCAQFPDIPQQSESTKTKNKVVIIFLAWFSPSTMCTIIRKKSMLRFQKPLKTARPIGVKACCLVITNTWGWRSLFNGACNFCLSWEKNSLLSDKNSSPKLYHCATRKHMHFIWKSNFCIKTSLSPLPQIVSIRKGWGVEKGR